MKIAALHREQPNGGRMQDITKLEIICFIGMAAYLLFVGAL
jgi:hypothetical protein